MRNDSVDVLRGAGIFVIVWSHLSLGILLDEIVNPIILGVFFLLSGMFHRTLPLQELLCSKGKRLVYPWLFFVFMGYVYHWLYSFVDSKPFDFMMLIEDLYTGGDFRANIPCWFLISLFEVILFYALLEKNIQSKGKRFIVLCILAGIGNGMLCEGWNHFYIGKSLFYLSLFGAGDMFLRSPIQISRGGVWLIVAMMLSVVMIYVTDSKFIDYILGGVAAYCTVAGSLSVLGTIKVKNALTVILCFLGKNSLVILSFHILALDFVWRLQYPCWGTPGVLFSFVLAIVVTALCVPMIYVYNNIIQPQLINRR